MIIRALKRNVRFVLLFAAILVVALFSGCAGANEASDAQEALPDAASQAEEAAKDKQEAAPVVEEAQEPQEQYVWDMGTWYFVLPEALRGKVVVEQTDANTLHIKPKGFSQYCMYTAMYSTYEPTGGDIGSPTLTNTACGGGYVALSMKNWVYFAVSRIVSPEFDIADTFCDGSASTLSRDDKNAAYDEIVTLQTGGSVSYEPMVDDVFYHVHETELFINDYANKALNYSQTLFENALRPYESVSKEEQATFKENIAAASK